MLRLKPSKIIQWIAALVVVPACAVLLMETMARLLGPDDLVLQVYPADLIETREGRSPFLNRAGYRGEVRGVPATTGPGRFRAEHAAEEGRARILLLGDSVLFGPGLPDEQTAGPVLEALLGGRMHVMNASVPGWATSHQLDYLREFGVSLAPDRIVLGYCLNDPFGAPDPFARPGEAAGEAWGALPRSINAILRRHSYFHVWLKGALKLERRAYGYEPMFAPLFEESSWEANRRQLEEVHRWAEARSIRLILQVVPHRDQLDPSLETGDRPQRLLAALGDELGVPVLDGRAVLGYEDYLVADPIHLDARGMRKLMRQIADYDIVATKEDPDRHASN